MKLKSLLLTTAFIGASLLAIAPEAQARCKVKGPMGTWTYVPCGPQPPKPRPIDKRQRFWAPEYTFKIYNDNNTASMTYYLNDKKYTLSAGYNRTHTLSDRWPTLEIDDIAGNGKWDNRTIPVNTGEQNVRIYRRGKYSRAILIDK